MSDCTDDPCPNCKARREAEGRQVQVRVMGADGEWFTPARNTDAILAALAAMRGDIEKMAGEYDDSDLRRIRTELHKLDAAITQLWARRYPAGSETAPMKFSELGLYMCVPADSCLHSPDIAITSDGVWVRKRPGGPSSSAHRDCHEARKGQS